MRTAVVRVNIDPGGELTGESLARGMAELAAALAGTGGEVLGKDLGAVPRFRREVQVLLDTADAAKDTARVLEACACVFGTEPVAGVVTYISRGTDADAHGVLAGFGITGEITRVPGTDGYDILQVRLREADLERVPESRIHTALEASTNCEVRISTV
ncbi:MULTISPECIES: hypothetical protein [Nocardia]|uniref:hypothetical protein n=1 Tax=Nocardia TaxID=1817 RepID=UPI00189381E9|nr:MULTISPECIES: hypothetical protein [Nocardia]MBF6352350.1 hypothetical protein [Nocardia flavorosea]